MATENPLRQSFKTTQNHTYSYIHIPPASPSKPTILFLHGFPSHICDWERQAAYFSSRGYGIVACDLLGYGQSSKPTDVSSYRLKPMGDEVVELLDSLNLTKVIGVGHDVGSTLLSRLAAYHPDRWLALVFLAVGPPKMGTPFNLDFINDMTKQAMGFELLGYINWLSTGEDNAQPQLEKHPESAMSLIFAADPKTWQEWFHPLGKMETFVTEDRRVLIGSWYSEELQRKHLDAFGREGGYTGATRWYQMWRDNLFAPDEKGFEDVQLQQPSLFLVSKEPEAGAEQQRQMLAAWAPHLQVAYVDAGHWLHLQRSEEVNAAIEEFIQNKRSS